MGFVYPMHLPTHQPLAPASPSLHPYTPPTTAVQFLLKTWPLPWFSSPWAFQALHNLHVMSVAHALLGALPGSLLPAIHCIVWHLALPVVEADCVPFGRLGAFRWLVVGGNHRLVDHPWQLDLSSQAIGKGASQSGCCFCFTDSAHLVCAGDGAPPGAPHPAPGPSATQLGDMGLLFIGGPIQKQPTVVSAVTRGRICWKTQIIRLSACTTKRSQIFDMFLQ